MSQQLAAIHALRRAFASMWRIKQKLWPILLGQFALSSLYLCAQIRMGQGELWMLDWFVLHVIHVVSVVYGLCVFFYVCMADRSERVRSVEALQGFAAALRERKLFSLLCVAIVVHQVGNAFWSAKMRAVEQSLHSHFLIEDTLIYLFVTLGLTLLAFVLNAVWQWLFALMARDHLEKSHAALNQMVFGEKPALYAIFRLLLVLGGTSAAVIFVSTAALKGLSCAVDISANSSMYISRGVSGFCQIVLNAVGAAAVVDLCSRRVAKPC